MTIASAITRLADLALAPVAQRDYRTYPIGHPECPSGGIVVRAVFSDGSAIGIDQTGKLTSAVTLDAVNATLTASVSQAQVVGS